LRKRVVLIITLILIVAIVLITFIAHEEKNQFKVPTINNISSIKIVPATTGPIMVGKQEEFTFDLNVKAHQAMANNILSWLKSGRMMGNDNNKAVSNGGTPTYLIIELKNGTSICIKSAVGASYLNTSNGKVIQSQNTDGQVSIYTTNPQEDIRELSPELKSFLNNGWKGFFNYNKK